MTILEEVQRERESQDKRWGHEADDAKNAPNDWAAYVTCYAMRWFPNGFAPWDSKTVDHFRASMIKTAALAIAAVESLDRQRAEQGAAFYERPTHDDAGENAA